MNFKIGDRIFVRGYIDEIRKDTVIVRNDGGYFGTILSEVMGELPSARPEIIRCKDCKYAHLTVSGECKYCDAWTDDDGYPMEIYEDGDFFCGNAERKEI